MKIKFLLLLALTICTACESEFKKAAEQYYGDGVIKVISYDYLPFLKVEGYTISFPSFDLSEQHQATYKLSPLPPQRSFVLHLVVEEDGTDRFSNNKHLTSRNCNGTIAIQLKDNSTIIGDINKIISDLGESSPSDNWTYLHDSDNFLFKPLPNKHYTITLSYQPNGYIDKKKAYLLIKCGGSP